MLKMIDTPVKTAISRLIHSPEEVDVLRPQMGLKTRKYHTPCIFHSDGLNNTSELKLHPSALTICK